LHITWRSEISTCQKINTQQSKEFHLSAWKLSEVEEIQ